MGSRIFSIKTKEAGKMAPFESEQKMEDFLRDHPKLIGCNDPNNESKAWLIEQQLSIVKGSGAEGRIDLVGLTWEGKNRSLTIFELKNEEINPKHVEQLVTYLEGWHRDKAIQKKIYQSIEDWNLGFGRKTIEKLLKEPKGVMVGPSFSAEAIALALKKEIGGIRLARFMESSSNWHVLIEDQVGNRVKRTTLSWKDLQDAKLMTTQDRLYLEGERKIFAKPDAATLDRSGKLVVLEKESRNYILSKRRKIQANAHRDDRWTIKQGLEALDKSKALSITTATCLSFMAVKGKRGSYWVPSIFWKLCKNDKTISELESKIR